MVAFGVLSHLLRRHAPPRGAMFRNRYFYARWLFFVLHEGLLTAGIYLVAKQHLPFVILVNYLWPTAVILCSVMLAGVTIRRWWAFLLGSSIVALSMLPEIVGPLGHTSDIFARKADCFAYGIVFVGAVSWGLYSALSRREGDSTGGAMVLPMFQATLALALPISFLPGMATWNHLTPLPAVLLIVYCFLLFIAYVAWDAGMRQGNVVILSLLADFIPWLSLISTNMMLHITISRGAVVSAAVLVLGAMTARYGTSRQKTVVAAYDEPGI